MINVLRYLPDITIIFVTLGDIRTFYFVKMLFLIWILIYCCPYLCTSTMESRRDYEERIDIERAIIRRLINDGYIIDDFIYQWESLRRKSMPYRSNHHVFLSEEEHYNKIVNLATIHRALKKFQSAHSLIETGIIDNAVIRTIYGDKYQNMTFIDDGGLYDFTNIPTYGDRSRVKRGIEDFSTVNVTISTLNLRWMLVNVNKNISRNLTLLTRYAINNALIEWQTALNITFSETSNIHDALIRVSFEYRNHNDNFPFDGRGNILGHSYYPGTDKEGIIHLDIEEDWTYDRLYCVILHELGHTFGLAHSSVKEAVMYAWYSNNKKLDDDDKHAISSLYGLKSKWGPIDRHRKIFTDRVNPVETVPRINNSHYTLYKDRSVFNIFNSSIQIY